MNDRFVAVSMVMGS